MDITTLLNSWEVDSNIDSVHLDVSALDTSKLHAKYLRLFSENNLKLIKLEKELKELSTTKFKYYRGELTKEELSDLGWPQYQGVKPIKSEMEQFLSGDSDLNNLSLKIEYMKTFMTTLDSILSQIKARDWQIKNAIEFKKFLAGLN